MRRVAWLVLLSLSGCAGERGPGSWVEGEGHRSRALHPRGVVGGGFRLVPPEQSGITAANEVSEAEALANRTLADGSGVAIADYDGDGLADIYVARIGRPNALYRNLGGWRFEDVTATAGVGLADRPSTGTAFADVDGDGDSDLIVTALGAPNTLFRNDGAGRFTDVSEAAGFTAVGASRSLALADADGDGDLDLYVTNNRAMVLRDLFPPEQRTSEFVLVPGRCEVRPELRDYWGVECFEGGVRRFEVAEEDEFYLNDGAGGFARASFTDGRFLDIDGRPLDEAPRDWGLSVRFHDLDADGTQDLYVCNDFESPDHIWLNQGEGRFRAAAPEQIRTTSLACMAVDFADVNRDGHQDLFSADMEPLGEARRKRTIPPMASDSTAPGALERRVQRARNTLQLARGDGTYSDVAHMAGVAGSEWTWGSLFLDVDLDGWEDLLLATGHVWDLLDADTQLRAVQARGSVDWRQEQRVYPPGPARNLAFRNRGDGTFEERGQAWGFARDADISHGLAAGDLDQDGDLDLVLTRLNASPLVLENRAAGGRVAVRLAGRPPNTAGIGAVIRVMGGAVPDQRREVAGAGGYLSASDASHAFATGEAGTVDVEVTWPSGAISRVEGVAPNREFEIREPDAAVTRRPREPLPLPTFVRVELDHRHVEPFFDELARQPMLSERLAQAGPGVSWIDVDRDGDADLLVGAGRGGRLGLLENDAGSLRRAGVRLPAAEFDQTTILPLPGANGTRLLVGSMAYEAETPDVARESPAAVSMDFPGGLEGGTAITRAVLPGALESTGPLALADVDGDGDLDLFVGRRALPARYPAPVSSTLYVNRDGAWEPDAAFASLLARVGVVSAALFTDIDADGDPDLALAVDWGPVRVFRNDGGRFRDATRALGLDAHPGRWNGLASGDLDGDGAPELIATSWGLNGEHGASPDRPLLAYHGDLDGNGSWELIRARADESGVVRPLEDLRRLGPALPLLRQTVGSFADYSTAALADVLGAAATSLQPLSAVTLAHTVFLNRGDRFEARALPTEAQVAPSFYVGVADRDGDGAEDVFLTQNFFATIPGEARYDAGRSLWLAGDGRGGLTAVPGQESGVAVYGDPRGAALSDFDGDGRVDLAVSQNGAATVLYRNVGATPGLRVRLVGPPGNPDAIGSTVRLLYAEGAGPAREVQAGSGYWSVNDPVQVLGLAGTPRALRVRWPGGEETEVSLEPGQLEVTAVMP